MFYDLGRSKCPRSLRRPSRWPQPVVAVGSPLGRDFAPRTRPNAISRHPERRDGAQVPPIQGDQTGQHPRRGYRRRKPQAHPRPYMDNHPTLSGKQS